MTVTAGRPAGVYATPVDTCRRDDALARHITKLVDGFPPLTAEQRARLATLLHPQQDGAGGAA